jgi:hypothetical protein
VIAEHGQRLERGRRIDLKRMAGETWIVDNVGSELMLRHLAARAGFDPNASVTLWQKMGQASDGAAPPAFLSTHPKDETRIAELRRLIPTVQPLYAAAAKG